jgi:hypothetical protein
LIYQYMDKAVSLSEFSRVIIEKDTANAVSFSFGIRQLPILAAVRNSRIRRSRYSRPPVHAAACPRSSFAYRTSASLHRPPDAVSSACRGLRYRVMNWFGEQVIAGS